MRPLSMRAGLLALTCLPLALPAWAAQEAPIVPEPSRSAELRRISLEEALQLALQHNIGIQISRTGPKIAAEQERAARGAFDVQASAGATFAHTELPTSSPLTPGGISSDDWDYTTGLGGRLPFGLQYQSTFNLHRAQNKSAIESLARSWTGKIENQVTLPLLQGLMHNPANVTVKQGGLQREISEEDFRRDLMKTVVEVESAYWGLSTAIAQDRVAQKSLGRAQDLLEQTRIQFEVGVVSKVEVAQARAGVAEREFNAIQKRNELENQQDRLLDATLAPSYSTFRDVRLEPVMPFYREFTVDEPTAVEIALRSRPEILSSRKAVAQAELGTKLAGNNRLPKLDLVGGYTVNGLAGKFKPVCQTFSAAFDPRCDPASPAFDPTASTPPLGSSHDVADRFADADGAHSWSVGGQFAVPIGNTTGRARAAESRLQLHKARRGLAQQRQAIVLDVRGAVREHDAAVKAYQAAQRRLEASAESLRAEEERLRLGDSTPFRVLEVEEDLVEAETQVNASLQRLQTSITGIQRAQGTLLEARGISIESELAR